MLAWVTSCTSCACTSEIKLQHLTVLHFSLPVISESDPLHFDASYIRLGWAIALLSYFNVNLYLWEYTSRNREVLGVWCGFVLFGDFCFTHNTSYGYWHFLLHLESETWLNKKVCTTTDWDQSTVVRMTFCGKIPNNSWIASSSQLASQIYDVIFFA